MSPEKFASGVVETLEFLISKYDEGRAGYMEIGHHLDDLRLPPEQRQQVLNLMRESMIEASHSVLTAIEGNTALGGEVQKYTLADANGNSLSGELDQLMLEQLQGHSVQSFVFAITNLPAEPNCYGLWDDGYVRHQLGGFEFKPSAEAWIRFASVIESKCIVDWDEEYFDPEINDGTAWEFSFDDRRILAKSSGLNEAPVNFPLLIDAVCELLGLTEQELYRDE